MRGRPLLRVSQYINGVVQITEQSYLEEAPSEREVRPLPGVQRPVPLVHDAPQGVDLPLAVHRGHFLEAPQGRSGNPQSEKTKTQAVSSPERVDRAPPVRVSGSVGVLVLEVLRRDPDGSKHSPLRRLEGIPGKVFSRVPSPGVWVWYILPGHTQTDVVLCVEDVANISKKGLAHEEQHPGIVPTAAPRRVSSIRDCAEAVKVGNFLAATKLITAEIAPPTHTLREASD